MPEDLELADGPYTDAEGRRWEVAGGSLYFLAPAPWGRVEHKPWAVKLWGIEPLDVP